VFPTDLWTFPVAVGLEAAGIISHVLREKKIRGVDSGKAAPAVS